ncbi:MAG: hypothetical protein HOM68_28385 [Gemmatimonadetes bacterium]|nr:hypothetical protein [Gemmatimonadota bacterium]MBT5060496.1 hypothetical protein [Gemmatimonadota bacterium]MBT5142533.1 hypothetical protein [Gemmatimonadota bacterium]MBT5587166.1 hypothetical protein [Gemmatimonadota bacterium]MBT5961170.1 hypothetical protein [Gemmatimonadota bacterium]
MAILAQYWMIPLGIAFVGAALTLFTLWQMRRRQQNKLALRVLAGQRRLLGEEIEERMEDLSQVDDTDLRQRIQASFGFVDDLHVGALERQAHLQNLEDLAHLQRHKITILSHHLDSAAHDAVPQVEHNTYEEEELPQTREGLEDDLLGRISQLAPKKDKRPPRR